MVLVVPREAAGSGPLWQPWQCTPGATSFLASGRVAQVEGCLYQVAQTAEQDKDIGSDPTCLVQELGMLDGIGGRTVPPVFA